jgi:PmbA protein
MDYSSLAEQLVAKCLSKGADTAEVYLEEGRHLSIEVRNGEVETVQEAASHGVGFRVFRKGRMAFSHCNDLSEAALEDAAASAVLYAANTTADENNILPDGQSMSDVGPLHDPRIAETSMEKKIMLAREVEALAMEDARITKSDGAVFAEGEGRIFLANSHGLSKNYRESVCTVGVSVVAEKGEQKSSGGEYCSRRFLADLKPIREIAEKAAGDAYGMLDPKMVPTQKAAVVFHPDAARAVLGGILAAVHGERVLQGASFLADKRDQAIAGSLVTLVDDGTLARGLATAPFDGEGVPVQKRVIVDKGVLKGFMYNTSVASRAGTRSTGNGSRRSFRSLPGIGAHCFYMTAGEMPPEEIVKATKTGLLLRGVTGYGINPVSGNFSGGASGFWIENGEIVFPVKGLTIAGTADVMLKGIDMLGNDLDLNRGIAAPTFRIPNMQIGGA